MAAVERAGADWIHVDVMDGHFVPNLTIGPVVVEAVRRSTSLPLDVHLMIEQPERYVTEFVKAGAATIGVQVEACPHLHRTLAQIREAGARASVVLNPGTPALAIEPVLSDVDQVLVMTVNPGFGGQKFIESMLAKIATLRAHDRRARPRCRARGGRRDLARDDRPRRPRRRRRLRGGHRRLRSAGLRAGDRRAAQGRARGRAERSALRAGAARRA